MATRRLLSILEKLVIFALVGGICTAVYYYNPSVRTATREVTRYYAKLFGLEKPCTEPILYSVKTIDPRFGITKEQLEVNIERAAKIWSDQIGKPLFKKSIDGDLTISLVYDNRQQTTNDLKEIGNSIDRKKADYDSLKLRYESLKDSYEIQKRAIDLKISSFNSDKAAYEEQVRYWNKRGGAPSNEAAKLDQQRAELNAKAAEISKDESAINALVIRINEMTNDINILAKELNYNVNTYNTTGASTGKEFNEGEYVRDATGERITIYQFESNLKLIRVLEHELGHALGLGHVKNVKSIMYYLNAGENEKLTPEDVVELKSACRLTVS